MPLQSRRQTIEVKGLVQGVGFRPFVFRLATSLSLGGWVCNDASGVTICLEGPADVIGDFERRLCDEHPPLARIDQYRILNSEPISTWGIVFEIRESRALGTGALVTPDSHVCADCLCELFDPADRRYGYPFINCTNCGPRYTIISSLPYDRPATTMSDFAMCEPCRDEYADPLNRRFHAQPNACWDCGPQAALVSRTGTIIDDTEPVSAAAARLRSGMIVAVKALGGYQLCVDPRNQDAVERLRRRKDRSDKPFALLARDLGTVLAHAHLSGAEERLLTSPARPIVLLRRRDGSVLSPLIAPKMASFGFMLPSSPLQHLLLAEDLAILVATSGNSKDSPMAGSEPEAFDQLGDIAEVFLIHDRRIHALADDSVARIIDGEPSFIRRGRGYSPDVLPLPTEVRPVIALGPELKATICVAKGRIAYLGPHIGDLKSPGNQLVHSAGSTHLLGLFGVTPEVVAHDLHPNFYSSAAARAYPAADRIPVQHHHAHMAACMVDNGLSAPVIGVVFDGTGYGLDGTIWGGEFLVGDLASFERFGHLETFRLPGGDAAIRQPWRIAAGLVGAHHLGEATTELFPCFTEVSAFEMEVLTKMVQKGVNSPVTSSVGRLFDAVSSLLGVCSTVSYEGQAAIELEQLIAYDPTTVSPWPTEIFTDDVGARVLSYRPWLAGLVEACVNGLRNTGIEAAHLSRRFHESIVHGVQAMCVEARKTHGLDDVVLTGGVFLNQHLTVRCHRELTEAGFLVHRHHRIPTNDGGISVGQAAVAGQPSRECPGLAHRS